MDGWASGWFVSVNKTHVCNLVHNREVHCPLAWKWVGLSALCSWGVRHLKHLAYIAERRSLICPKQTFNINRYTWCFPATFQKRNSFCHFLIASLQDKTLQKWGLLLKESTSFCSSTAYSKKKMLTVEPILSRKNLLKEQISSFKTFPHLWDFSELLARKATEKG